MPHDDIIALISHKRSVYRDEQWNELINDIAINCNDQCNKCNEMKTTRNKLFVLKLNVFTYLFSLCLLFSTQLSPPHY